MLSGRALTPMVTMRRPPVNVVLNASFSFAIFSADWSWLQCFITSLLESQKAAEGPPFWAKKIKNGGSVVTPREPSSCTRTLVDSFPAADLHQSHQRQFRGRTALD